MLNYILFLDKTEPCSFTPSVDETSTKKIYQIAREQLELYQLPNWKQCIYVHTTTLCSLTENGGETVLAAISNRVYRCKQWRLILLYPENFDIEDAQGTLQSFTQTVMQTPSPTDNSLTCIYPEQIWIVALKNSPYDREAEWPAKLSDYTGYPSNCRFIISVMDFQVQSLLEEELFKTNCGVLSLITSNVVSDALPAYASCSLDVEIDWERFGQDVREYDMRLRNIWNCIEKIRLGVLQEKRLLTNELPTINITPCSIKNIPKIDKDSQRTAKKMKVAIRQMRNIVDARLESYEEKEKNSVKRKIFDLEKGLEEQGTACLQLEEEIIHRGTVQESEMALFGLGNGTNHGKQTPRHEIYTRGMKAMDEKEEKEAASNWRDENWIELFFSVFLCFGIPVYLKYYSTNAQVNLVELVPFLFVSVLVFLVAIVFSKSKAWRNTKKVIHDLETAEINRITRNNLYLSRWGSYLKSYSILEYSKKQKLYKSKEYIEETDIHEQKWEMWSDLCGQLMVLCKSTQNKTRSNHPHLDVTNLLQRNLDDALYLFSDATNRADTVSESGIQPAFCFVKEVKLKRHKPDLRFY